jgi:hypothetical protein
MQREGASVPKLWGRFGSAEHQAEIGGLTPSRRTSCSGPRRASTCCAYPVTSSREEGTGLLHHPLRGPRPTTLIDPLPNGGKGVTFCGLMAYSNSIAADTGKDRTQDSGTRSPGTLGS